MLGDDGRSQLEDGLEVDQMPLPAQFLVGGIHPRRLFRPEWGHPARLGRGCRVVIGPDLGDFGPFDLGGDVSDVRKASRQPQPARGLGQEADLGIQHGGRPPAHCARPEVFELPERGRVEGPGLHALHPDVRGPELAQPPAQLTRRAGGERQREHVARVYHAGPHRVGDAMGDGPRLARARACQHADRAPGRHSDLALLWIERGKDGFGAVW